MRLRTLLYWYITFGCSVSEKFEYISTEHPTVTYRNPKFLAYLKFTSRRHGRNDPFYYVDLHANVLHSWGDNVTFNFYIYEWLTNQYKRSFVEMHFTTCDLLQKDKFFGAPMRQGRLTGSCPYPAGVYDLYNMTVPIKQIPPQFPFRKGRIYINVSVTDTNDVVGTGHIDMEIKTFNTKHT